MKSPELVRAQIKSGLGTKEDMVMILGCKDRTPEYYIKIGVFKKGVRLKNDRRVFWDMEYLHKQALKVKLASIIGYEIKDIKNLRDIDFKARAVKALNNYLHEIAFI